MDHSPDIQEIEKIYQVYRNTAIRIKKEVGRQTLPLSILGLICMLGGISSVFWAGYRTSANLWCWGTALGIFFSLIALIVQLSNANKRASQVAKPGFMAFFKKFNTWGAPKTVSNSSYLETFKQLIGKG